jgi:hypothetical protein
MGWPEVYGRRSLHCTRMARRCQIGLTQLCPRLRLPDSHCGSRSQFFNPPLETEERELAALGGHSSGTELSEFPCKFVSIGYIVLETLMPLKCRFVRHVSDLYPSKEFPNGSPVREPSMQSRVSRA